MEKTTLMYKLLIALNSASFVFAFVAQLPPIH